MTDTIKAFLEADAKRTQGEWECIDREDDDYEQHSYSLIRKSAVQSRFASCSNYEPDDVIADDKLHYNTAPAKNDANFIALASTLAPAIRTMMERLEKLKAEHNSALADIEMAREALQHIYGIEHERGGSLGSDGQFYTKIPERSFELAKKALSALDKYKGGV